MFTFMNSSTQLFSQINDLLERNLDLNELVTQNPEATFFVRIQGDSMSNIGIFSGDIAIVDRSISSSIGNVIVVGLDGEFALKRLIKKEEHFWLQSENPQYPSIQVKNPEELDIWGVVTYVLHKVH